MADVYISYVDAKCTGWRSAIETWMAQFVALRRRRWRRRRRRRQPSARARYQSPVLKAISEQVLKRERARRRSRECASLSAPTDAIYERVFEPYHTCPYCRATRASFSLARVLLVGVAREHGGNFRGNVKYFASGNNDRWTGKSDSCHGNWSSQYRIDEILYIHITRL